MTKSSSYRPKPIQYEFLLIFIEKCSGDAPWHKYANITCEQSIGSLFI